jgi:hypothetical protein
MKQIFVFIALIFSFAGCLMQSRMAAAQTVPIQQTQSGESKEAKSKAPIMLELYTSEGCPTCPPADANLALLERTQPVSGTEIVTLALHVDYWNSLRWRDEYSSPIFSRRQQLYTRALKIDSSYTPQMIVDGQKELIGNNMAKAQKAIIEAARLPKAAIEILEAADKFKIKIFNVPAHQIATVFMAVTEDNLASNRKYGAAAEKKAAHISVVRELKSIGLLTAEQTSLEIDADLHIQPAWKKENLKLIVFVQENTSRKILGVSRKKLM